MKRTFGVDEAGRGPILGPMAIAVVCLDRQAAVSLSRSGVADSKTFGPSASAREQRSKLSALIRRQALLCAVETVSVDEIDRHTFRGQLNALERKVVLFLLRKLDASRDDRIICDGARMFKPLQAFYPRLEAVDRGESVHVSVAAASIVAKDARDRAFAAIAQRYANEFGEIAGGGYLNPATKRFLDAYAVQYGGLPPEARKSWGAPKDENRSVL